MRRVLAVFLVAAVTVLPMGSALRAQPQPVPTERDGGIIIFKNPEHDRRLMIVGLGMVVGVVAYNYLAYSFAPAVPAVAGHLAAAQNALGWAAAQMSAAYHALGATAAGMTGAAGAASVAAPSAVELAAPAAVAALPPATAAAAIPAAAGLSKGVVNLAHMLGGIAALSGAVVGHYIYAVPDWLFGTDP